jgi:hypothetical protein
MVQLGGVEPPTSGSTDRRSNQLSYSCTSGRKLGANRRRFKRRLNEKSPAFAGLFYLAHATIQLILKFLVTLDLKGSEVSVATFWASAENSLACSENASTC